MPIADKTVTYNNNFTPSMTNYIMSLIDFYATNLATPVTFVEKMQTQLATQWKTKATVSISSSKESGGPVMAHWSNGTNHISITFNNEGVHYKMTIVAWNYSESPEIETKTTNGLAYDELTLLKAVTLVLANSTDQVQTALGIFGNSYHTYHMTITENQPTWVSNMGKRAILFYQGKYYFYSFASPKGTAVVFNNYSYRIG